MSDEAKNRNDLPFQRVVESSPLGMHFYELTQDNQLIFRGANPAADRILGVDNAHFVGKTIEEAFPQLAETEVPQRYRETAMTGTPWNTEQISYDDGEIAGAFQVAAFQTEKNRMAVHFMDITPQKSLESQLRIFEEAVGSSTDAIGISSPNGKHFYQNRAFDKLFGDVGDDPPQTLYVEETVGREVFSTIMGGEKWEGEVQMYSADGEIKDIFLRAYASKDDKGNVGLLVGVHTDITEKKRLMEATQRNQRLEALGLLAGGIAHDFNNVLGAIFGNVNLAMVSLPNDQAVQTYLSNVLSAMERATGLTNQLLTFSKGGSPIKKTQPLFPFVEETVRFALSGANVSCSFEFMEHLWPCDFDKNQIAQVIENITINALQAMPNGGKFNVRGYNVEDADVTHKGVKGRYVALEFQDTGLGMPDTILDQIFDPFFTTKQRGHGLGLATSHSIIKKHGGDIQVSSVVGQGTTFTLLLPAVKNSLGSTDAEASSEEDFSGTGKVLIMDDERMIRDILTGMLEALGFDVVTAREGKEAVELYQSHRSKGDTFQAMFLDLTVTDGMGGEEAVRAFRALGAEMPIFVVSGYACAPILNQQRRTDFTDGLSKPFKLTQLKALLARHLGL